MVPVIAFIIRTTAYVACATKEKLGGFTPVRTMNAAARCPYRYGHCALPLSVPLKPLRAASPPCTIKAQAANPYQYSHCRLLGVCTIKAGAGCQPLSPYQRLPARTPACTAVGCQPVPRQRLRAAQPEPLFVQTASPAHVRTVKAAAGCQRRTV